MPGGFIIYLKEPPPGRAAVHQETEIIFRCNLFYTSQVALLRFKANLYWNGIYDHSQLFTEESQRNNTSSRVGHGHDLAIGENNFRRFQTTHHFQSFINYRHRPRKRIAPFQTNTLR